MRKINEGFVCIECSEINPPSDKTCRNHCRKCFVSLHLDDNIPGDRKSNCGGKMYPIDYIIKGDEVKIKFRCEKCGKIYWNKSSSDDDILGLIYIIKKYINY